MASTRLRIAGGTARGLPLTEPRGVRLRPTSGMLREAIFNIIAEQVEGATVLDLYAGTGALGIESLSRGAARATFIEAEPAACQAILQTISRAGFVERAEVLRGRLPAALSGLHRPFDLILMDPPYSLETAGETLELVSQHLTPSGTVVYEHGSRYNPPERPAGLRLVERRIYGDSAIALYATQEVA
ncbi:MAG: 16S rRNA (guanine(966)-N(2))-methyltransferase RsmD [Tepidiformaceae bacterium]